MVPRVGVAFPRHTLAQDHKSFSRSGHISDASRLPPRDAGRSFPAPRQSDLSGTFSRSSDITRPLLAFAALSLLATAIPAKAGPTCSMFCSRPAERSHLLDQLQLTI
jgi:hypothetical protein